MQDMVALNDPTSACHQCVVKCGNNKVTMKLNFLLARRRSNNNPSELVHLYSGQCIEAIKGKLLNSLVYKQERCEPGYRIIRKQRVKLCSSDYCNRLCNFGRMSTLSEGETKHVSISCGLHHLIVHWDDGV